MGWRPLEVPSNPKYLVIFFIELCHGSSEMTASLVLRPPVPTTAGLLEVVYLLDTLDDNGSRHEFFLHLLLFLDHKATRKPIYFFFSPQPLGWLFLWFFFFGFLEGYLLFFIKIFKLLSKIKLSPRISIFNQQISSNYMGIK